MPVSPGPGPGPGIFSGMTSIGFSDDRTICP
jgi:hypothetical protein